MIMTKPRWFPVVNFGTKWIKGNLDAFVTPFSIHVKKGHEDDFGLIQHEWTHVKQWWSWWSIGTLIILIGSGELMISLVLGFLVFPALYLFSKKLRARFEAMAYAESVRYGMSVEEACNHMMKYKLGISKWYAARLIEMYL